MGKDNQPRHRLAKQLERKKPTIAPYARLLIVTEGEKTEPQYLEEIRVHYKLTTANIKITNCEYGTAPQQIVQFAEDIFKQTKQFDQVFCVFDRDEHQSFDNAVASATAKNKKFRNDRGEPVEFFAVPSNPCFELWLLLHFEQFNKLVHRDVISERLNKAGYINNYQKAQKGLFKLTREKINGAHINAEQLDLERARHGNNVPYTAVSALVKLLMNLRK